MKIRGEKGMTLTELIIAVGFSSLVFLALTSLTSLAARNQTHAMSSLSAELTASLAFKAVSRELSEATLLLSPSMAGLSSGVLEGCANAANVAAPTPIDPGRPMRFFAFCRSGSTLYHHSLPGCPASYSCGNNPLSAYGIAAVPLNASFLRPSPHKLVVETSLTAGSSGVTASRSSSFTLAAAAGRNQ